MKYRFLAVTMILCAFPFGAAHCANLDPFSTSVRLHYLLPYYLEDGLSVTLQVLLVDGKPALNGPFAVSTPEGIVILRGAFKNDQLDGEILGYLPDGRLISSGRYREGLQFGESVEWDDAGRVSRLTPHDERGENHGTERFHSEGVLSREIDWKNGEPLELRDYREGAVVRRLSGEELKQSIRERIRAEMKQKEEAQPGATDNPDGAQ